MARPDEGAPRTRGRLFGPRCASTDEGVTLIEMMAALIVLALFASAALVSITRGFDLTRTSHDRGLASSLASQELDKVRDVVGSATDASTLPVGQTSSTQTVDNVAFTITRQVEWVNQDSTAGPCDGGTGSSRSARAYLNVDVAVSWAKMSGVKPVHTDTIVYPKVGLVDPYTGAIAVKVQGASAAQGGIPVTLTGPASRTQTTASDGCAFFGYLPAGSYTAIATSPSYVDPTGASSATSTSITTSVGQITNVSLSYDKAAGFDVSPGIRTFALPTLSAGDRTYTVRYANSLLNSNTPVSQCTTSTSYPCSVRNIFPFTNDQVWVGECLDSRPGSTVAVVGLQPGKITPGTQLTNKLADLTVTVAGTTAKDVYIAHVADTSPAGCLTVPRYHLGKSAGGAGNVLKVAIPFGTWTVSTSSTTVPATTAPTGAANVTTSETTTAASAAVS